MVKTAGSGQPATTRKVQTSSTLPEVRASAALRLGRTCCRVSREASPCAQLEGGKSKLPTVWCLRGLGLRDRELEPRYGPGPN